MVCARLCHWQQNGMLVFEARENSDKMVLIMPPSGQSLKISETMELQAMKPCTASRLSRIYPTSLVMACFQLHLSSLTPEARVRAVILWLNQGQSVVNKMRVCKHVVHMFSHEGCESQSLPFVHGAYVFECALSFS